MDSISIFKEIKKTVILNLGFTKSLMSFYQYISTQTNTEISDYLQENKYSTIQEHFLELLQSTNKNLKVFFRDKLKFIFKEFHSPGQNKRTRDQRDQYMEIEKKILLDSKKMETILLLKLDSFNYQKQMELDIEIKHYLNEYFLNKKVFCFEESWDEQEDDVGRINKEEKLVGQVRNIYQEFQALQKKGRKMKEGLRKEESYKKLNKCCQVDDGPRDQGIQFLSNVIFL